MSGVNIAGTSTETVGNTAATITVNAGAKGAYIVVQSNPVAYKIGAAPVDAAGSCKYLSVGDSLIFDSWTYPGANWRSILNTIQFIRTGVADGILAITWYL